jgi:hypothetical protein
MFVAHMNGHCVETCANIKLSFFLHVLISLKKISFNIVRWYGSNHGGFVAMSVDPTYLHIYDNESIDEKADENHSKKPWVVDVFWLMTLNDTSPNVEKEKDHNRLSNSFSPMEKMLV